MTISSNYITLQQQIADEIGDRQDLLAPLSDSSLTASPIQLAIQQAIARWERQAFYFNDIYDTTGFYTSSGQEFYGASTAPVSYALIGTAAKLTFAHVTINNNRLPFTIRTPQIMDETSVNPNVLGQPVDISYFAEQLRFYPIPDNAYLVTLAGTQRLAALANPTDANAWTEDAEPLIRETAKLILANGTLHDSDLAEECKQAIYGDPRDPERKGHLYDLKAETTRRRGRGRIRLSYF